MSTQRWEQSGGLCSTSNATFPPHATSSPPHTRAPADNTFMTSQSWLLRLSDTYTAFALLPRNPLAAFLHNHPLQFISTYSQSPFLVESPVLNLNCLFCPFPLSSILLSGVRKRDRLWALNYPCSTLALKTLKQCGWTDFMSAMMVWRGIILFHWSPLVHLLYLHPSLLSSLTPSIHLSTHTCGHTPRCTYTQKKI